MSTLLEQARAMAPELTRLRHDLHRHPELGLMLPRTQEAVLAALDGLALEVSTGTSCTSVTAVLRGGGAGGPGRDDTDRPVVLLRGDLDALPVQEQADVAFRSQVDGVMHACGHDLHTAMLAGAARLLAAHRDRLAGDVVLMFQPGEEGYDGAGHMIAEGVLDAAGRRAGAAWALHVMSGLGPCGSVFSRAGTLMAASDGLFVTVRGRGGHGSTPHLARDPITAAAAMVTALQGLRTHALDAFSPAVVSVGLLRAGTQRNIIPDSARFEATVRSFDPAVRSVIGDAARRICEGVAAAHGVEVDVEFVQEYPPTVNDPAAVDLALTAAADLFGSQDVVRLPNPITGSEDFSRVLAQVPGAMVFLGASPSDVDPASAPSNHSPLARFDDAVLPSGAALLAELAVRSLAPSGTVT